MSAQKQVTLVKGDQKITTSVPAEIVTLEANGYAREDSRRTAPDQPKPGKSKND